MPVKITSKYTPLTYDEITRPLIQATEAQAAMENAYMDATDKAAQAMAAANQQSDPIAYNRLKAYAEDLQAHADSLVRNGLQRTSRQGLLNLRRRYGEEIAPIENAIARRRDLADEQRKLQATNPYLRFERNMDTTSLDDFLTNAELDYGRSIDLDDISKKAATITKALGQGRTDVRNGKQIDKYTKEILTREGFTPEEIQAALSNDENADYALKSALNNLYTSTGASSFSADVDTEVRDALDYGAYLGAGEVKSQIMADKEAERKDFEADRNQSQAFQAKMHGYMWDKEKKDWVKVGSNLTPKDFTIATVTIGDKTKNVFRSKTDGSWWEKSGKDFYPVSDEDAALYEFQHPGPEVTQKSRDRFKGNPLYFTGDDFAITRNDESEFNDEDKRKATVKFSELTTNAKVMLKKTLYDKGYAGIDPEKDLLIYKDPDWGKDDYKVELKPDNELTPLDKLPEEAFKR